MKTDEEIAIMVTNMRMQAFLVPERDEPNTNINFSARMTEANDHRANRFRAGSENHD